MTTAILHTLHLQRIVLLLAVFENEGRQRYCFINIAFMRIMCMLCVRHVLRYVQRYVKRYVCRYVTS